MKKKSAAPISFHMVLRSRVKKELKSIATLPEEIIFNILLLLPADILYAVLRFVCRQWYLIINDPQFVATHLQRSTSILLVQFPDFHCQYMHVMECDIKFSDIKFQFPGDVLATCNGLTLVRDKRYETTHRMYYIANPVTNRIMALPTLPLNVYSCSLVFVASTNTYKVVVVSRRCISPRYREFECAILTVNVDRAWRFINCANIGRYISSFSGGPITTRKYVYWASVCLPYMLALNAESENIKLISLEQTCRGDDGAGYLRAKGNTLSYIHKYKDCSVKLWVLKDDETEDWIKLPDLMVEELRREGTKMSSEINYPCPGMLLHPLTWSSNEEKILFKMILHPNSLLVYDVKTGGTFCLIMGIDGGTMSAAVRRSKEPHIPDIFPHTSSLTWVRVNLFMVFYNCIYCRPGKVFLSYLSGFYVLLLEFT